jgi:uncharacterized RmlC-like cupin family protein
MWVGLFLVETGACTGIRHHEVQRTIAYVLSGSSYVQWGEQGALPVWNLALATA